MPHAFRIFKSIISIGMSQDIAVVVGGIVERARSTNCAYRHENVVDCLFDVGCEEKIAAAFSRVLRNCFFSEKQGDFYDRPRLKRALISAGLEEETSETFLLAVDQAVLTPRAPEIRVPILFAPGAGRVVMCDFTHLIKPEMLKERRAIVISPRSNNAPGRCTVVPVSKSAPRGDPGNYFEFAPGSYPFFHPKEPVWAVCDHVYTVALSRLWRVNVDRRPQLPSLRPADFERVRSLVGTALGVPPLTNAPDDEYVRALAGDRATT